MCCLSGTGVASSPGEQGGLGGAFMRLFVRNEGLIFGAARREVCGANIVCQNSNGVLSVAVQCGWSCLSVPEGDGYVSAISGSYVAYAVSFGWARLCKDGITATRTRIPKRVLRALLQAGGGGGAGCVVANFPGIQCGWMPFLISAHGAA